MYAHEILRAKMAAAHAAIDVAFADFDLGDRESYIRFLLIHARALSAIEAAVGHSPDLPSWRPRTALLESDLEAFGYRLPEPLAVGPILGLAEKFGLLYVIEGSRLGGRILSRRVAQAFPSAYLSSVHEHGEWRTFTSTLDERASAENAAWLDGVLAGANCGFGLYARSAKGRAEEPTS